MESKEKEMAKEGMLDKPLARRMFIKYAGITTVASTIIVAACKNDDEGSSDSVNLGKDDTGILNYAYALEQLEAAFYTQVVAHQSFMTIFSEEERTILSDLKDHEVAHREFLKAALGPDAIRNLEVNFASINFGDKNSVLTTARTFEDLGVSAYNGAGKLLKDVNLLLVAGKIVSVEARHAAAIRDLISPKSASFSGDDVVDPMTGFDMAMDPADVLEAAAPFLITKINYSGLPTS
jgi:hypothetical protein